MHSLISLERCSLHKIQFFFKIFVHNFQLLEKFIKIVRSSFFYFMIIIAIIYCTLVLFLLLSCLYVHTNHNYFFAHNFIWLSKKLSLSLSLFQFQKRTYKINYSFRIIIESIIALLLCNFEINYGLFSLLNIYLKNYLIYRI